MRRVLGLGLLLIMIAGCAPGGPLGASTSDGPGLVPDPRYTPREGDRVTLHASANSIPDDGIPILSDLTAYDKFGRCLETNDSFELRNLEQQNWLQYAPVGTSVFIEKIVDRRHTGAQLGAQVRVLDGPHKGRVVWTRAEHLARLVRPEPEQ